VEGVPTLNCNSRNDGWRMVGGDPHLIRRNRQAFRSGLRTKENTMHTIPRNVFAPAPQALPPVLWVGASGRQYALELYPIGTQFKDLAGVYIFCRPAPTGQFQAVYIGQTDNFRRRLTEQLRNHHQWVAICGQRATHICVLQVPQGDAARLAIETDLRRGISTPCNDQ
jgi:hypothetical protein